MAHEFFEDLHEEPRDIIRSYAPFNRFPRKRRPRRNLPIPSQAYTNTRIFRPSDISRNAQRHLSNGPRRDADRLNAQELRSRASQAQPSNNTTRPTQQTNNHVPPIQNSTNPTPSIQQNNNQPPRQRNESSKENRNVPSPTSQSPAQPIIFAEASIHKRQNNSKDDEPLRKKASIDESILKELESEKDENTLLTDQLKSINSQNSSLTTAKNQANIRKDDVEKELKRQLEQNKKLEDEIEQLKNSNLQSSPKSNNEDLRKEKERNSLLVGRLNTINLENEALTNAKNEFEDLLKLEIDKQKKLEALNEKLIRERNTSIQRVANAYKEKAKEVVDKKLKELNNKHLDEMAELNKKLEEISIENSTLKEEQLTCLSLVTELSEKFKEANQKLLEYEQSDKDENARIQQLEEENLTLSDSKTEFEKAKTEFTNHMAAVNKTFFDLTIRRKADKSILDKKVEEANAKSIKLESELTKVHDQLAKSLDEIRKIKFEQLAEKMAANNLKKEYEEKLAEKQAKIDGYEQKLIEIEGALEKLHFEKNQFNCTPLTPHTTPTSSAPICLQVEPQPTPSSSNARRQILSNQLLTPAQFQILIANPEFHFHFLKMFGRPTNSYTPAQIQESMNNPVVYSNFVLPLLQKLNNQ